MGIEKKQSLISITKTYQTRRNILDLAEQVKVNKAVEDRINQLENELLCLQKKFKDTENGMDKYSKSGCLCFLSVMS
uniref:Uncharacterized protein n=1 Tax=Spermophilus dauricus TaxID=99837 RepID=A0A8C9PIR0_SPEDA